MIVRMLMTASTRLGLHVYRAASKRWLALVVMLACALNMTASVAAENSASEEVRVLQRLGSQHVLVVYGMNGMDEVSLSGETMVGELKNGEITEYEIHPEDFGLPMASNRALKVDTPEQSRNMLVAVLDNQPGAARDIVVLNAGVALYAANVAGSMKEGVEQARAALESGAAKTRLAQFVAATTSLAG